MSFFLNSHNVRLRHLSRAKGASPGDQTLHPGFHEKFFPPVAGLRKVHQKSTNNDLGVRSD